MYVHVHVCIFPHSEGVMVTRICGPGGIWFEPNFSGCTLTSGDPQQFMIFSLHYIILLGTQQDVNEGIDMIKEEVHVYVHVHGYISL